MAGFSTGPSGGPPTIYIAQTYSPFSIYCTPYEYKVTIQPKGTYADPKDITVYETGVQSVFQYYGQPVAYPVVIGPNGQTTSTKYYTYTNTYPYYANTAGNNPADPVIFWIDFPSIPIAQATAVYNVQGVTKGELTTDLSSFPLYKGVGAGDTQTQGFDLYWYGSPLAPH